MPSLRQLLDTLALLSALPAWVGATSLHLTVYNPQTTALFPVSSVLVEGRQEAILIDAQFGQTQAAHVVQQIRHSGKRLSLIYISHGDPDYYFGLHTLLQAFPKTPVMATAQTVAHIRATHVAKLAFWGPKLGADAPSQVHVPQVLKGNQLILEGHTQDLQGLDGPQPERSFVWIPSLKAVVGGVVLDNNQHLWMADTRSRQSQDDWIATVQAIEQLKPAIIVPGHYLEGPSPPLQAANFTLDYLRAFQHEAAQSATAQALEAAMVRRYPQFEDHSGLAISARVVMGEMAW